MIKYQIDIEKELDRMKKKEVWEYLGDIWNVTKGGSTEDVIEDLQSLAADGKHLFRWEEIDGTEHLIFNVYKKRPETDEEFDERKKNMKMRLEVVNESRCK